MRKNVKKAGAVAVLALVVGAGASACDIGGDDSGPKGGVSAQNLGNNDNNAIASWANRAVRYPYRNQDPTDPLEIKNLARRLTYFNSKGSTGYVYLLAPNTDKVIGYYVISGKVSSTGSQMTATQAVHNCSDQYGGSCTATDSIGDDGSYGPEEGGQQGVFFFTTTGTLVETVMPWIYSSQPLKVYADAPMLDSNKK